MGTETYVVEDQFNRIQGAMLTVQSKKFSIYKGVNIIGRNRSATVNIKNLNVSQHHAMIIIVDDSQHYVSDLNSSNGTYLFGNKITPFKLYEITNDTEIKFGDVTGLYVKMLNSNATVHLEAGTMELTQNFSQTFYAAQTQALLEGSSLNQSMPSNPQQNSQSTQSVSNAETQDIHEAATQVVIYPPIFNGTCIQMDKNLATSEEIAMDIHNAPTQVVTNKQPSTSIASTENIHEAVTQPVAYPQTIRIPDQPEENIHEVATQIVNYPPKRLVIDEIQERHNIPANSTVTDIVIEANENISVNFDSVIEETVIEESVMEEGPSSITEKHIQTKDDENSNESVDFLTINRPPDVEKQTQNMFCPSENDDRNSPNLNSEDIGRTKKRPVRKLSSSESLLESQNNKQALNSDSETDIETVGAGKSKRLLPMVNSSQSGTESIITNGNIKRMGKVIDSDSETDIEDDEIRNILGTVNNEGNKKKPSQNDSNKNLKKCTNKTVNSDSETDIEDNEDLSVAQDYIDKNRTKKRVLRKLSSSQSDIESKTGDANSEQSSEVIIRRRTNKARVINSDSETDLEEDKSKSEKKAERGKLDIHSDSETDVEDFKEDAQDARQMPVTNSDSDTDIEIDKTKRSAQNEDDNTAEGINDTDYIPATQDAFANVFQYSSKSNINSDNVSSEESFKLGLTELMIDENDLVDRNCRLNKKSEEKSPKFTRSLNEMKNTLEKNKVDKQQEICNNDSDIDDERTNKTSDKIDNTMTEIENDLYSMATQKIDDKLPNRKNEIEVAIENGERIGSTARVSKDIQMEDFDILPTQKMGLSSKDSLAANSDDQKNKADEDIYIMATQKLRATQMSNMEKNISSRGAPAAKTSSDVTSVMGKDADISKIQADNEKDDEFYMLPTQKINESGTNFKVPPKFNFKKKITNLDGSLTTILRKAHNIDPYSVNTQELGQTNDCNPNTSGGSKEDVDDVYLQPTQELPGAINMQMDSYMAETQEVKDNFISESDVVTNDGKKVVVEKVFVMETQTELYMSANKKIAVQSSSYSESAPTGQNEDDVHDVPKKPIVCYLTDLPDKSNEISPKRVKKSDIDNLKKTIKSNEFEKREDVRHENELDLNRPETLSQIEAFVKKPLRSYSKSEKKLPVYDEPTQPLVNLLMDASKKYNEIPQIDEAMSEGVLNTSNLKRLGEVSTDVPKIKRVKKSDIANLKKTIESNKIEGTENIENDDHDADRPETLSQIETFIKRPLRTYKAASKSSGNRYLTAKCIENDILQESETLSQIEAFIQIPMHKTDSLQKTNRNERILSPNREEEERPETLSQIESFIKKPLTPKKKRVTNIKRGKASTSTISNKTVVHKTDTESCSNANSRAELEQVLSTSSPKRTKGKRSRLENNDKEQNTKLKMMESEKYTSSNESDDNLNTNASSSKSSEQDTIRSDIDQSFALLEAKSTKTRKSQRVTNVEEVKVAVRKNRRSMAISSVSELAENEGTKKKPSTRKSSRVLNNNIESAATLTKIGDDSRSEKGTQIKDKFESSNSNFSEPEIPAKVIRMSTAKKGKLNTKISVKNDATKEKEVPIPALPAMSKTRVSVRMRAGNSDEIKSSGSESSISNNSPPVTPSKRGKKPVSKTESTPSASKTKVNSRVKNQSDTSAESSNCDSESVKSGDLVFSTPSRRGRSIALNETALTMSERSKRKLRPKVVFTMLDNPQLESLIRHLGGSIVDSVDASTVLVTEHVKRSQKLLSAVGQGKPICSPEWIYASKKANEFLDPWDFILIDKEAESKWNFSLKDAIRRAATEKLLTNYTFQLMVSSAADVLKGSIEACGGKCMKTSPKNVEGFLVIVASPENRSKFLRVKKQNPEVTIVEPEAVFDGVLRQELRLGRHLLT